MIQLRYFASLRDQLNRDSEELPWQPNFSTVKDIKNHLLECDDVWQNVLTNKTTLIAVNQQMANNNTAIKDGDEIAFFPPVTGG